MTFTTIYCSQLGKCALRIIKQNDSGRVSGVANRGIYITPDSGSAIYLSWELFRGPLTLNLGGDLPPFDQTLVNHTVLFNQNDISFPEDQIRIDLYKAKTWQPPSRDGESKFIDNRLKTIFHKAKLLKGREDSFRLLEQALSHKPAPISGIPGIEDKLGSFFLALKKGDLSLQAQRLTGLLGLGPGLTPVGDDYILGVLITLNRWGDLLKPGERFGTFNKIILGKAEQKTTNISTSLLVCAAEGAVDERIHIILDSFFSDNDLPESAVEDLLDWGSSSGIAVLAGMAAVLSQ